MTDFESRYPGLMLQPDEKLALLFYVVMFRVLKGRWPTLEQVKAHWEDV